MFSLLFHSVVLLAGATLSIGCPCSKVCAPPCNANLQYTTTLPYTANVPISGCLPLTATLPVNLSPKCCGCELELTPCGRYGYYNDLEPFCVPRCGCYTDLEPTCCSCLGPALPSCGCLPVCATVPACRCLEVDVPICTLPPVVDIGVLPGITSCGCNLVAPTCGCALPTVYGVSTLTAYQCPTLPPYAPEVGCCCGKYLRQICVTPPFL